MLGSIAAGINAFAGVLAKDSTRWTAVCSMPGTGLPERKDASPPVTLYRETAFDTFV
jgi:hypothetical protein